MAFRAALRFAAPLGFPKRWKEVSRLLRTDGLLFEIFSNVLLTVCLWRPVGFHHRGRLLPARHLFRLDRLDDDAMDAILAAEFFEPLKHGSHAA